MDNATKAIGSRIQHHVNDEARIEPQNRARRCSVDWCGVGRNLVEVAVDLISTFAPQIGAVTVREQFIYPSEAVRASQSV
jgi:hypothetical protein